MIYPPPPHAHQITLLTSKTPCPECVEQNRELVLLRTMAAAYSAARQDPYRDGNVAGFERAWGMLVAAGFFS